MKLAHPGLAAPIAFEENVIPVLVVENGAMLRKLLAELQDKVEGMGSEFVLSDEEDILDFPRNVEWVRDPLVLPFDSRRFVSPVEKAAAAECAAYEAELTPLFQKLSELAAAIAAGLSFDVVYAPPDRVESLIKCLNFRLDRSDMELPEQVLVYCRLCRAFFNKRLFVFYGLKGYLTDEEALLLYKNMCYEKMQMLLIEPCQRETIRPFERVTIIDRDLCEL